MKKQLLLAPLVLCLFTLGCEETSVDLPTTASTEAPGGLGSGPGGTNTGGGTDNGDNGNSGNNGDNGGGDNNGGDNGNNGDNGDNGGDDNNNGGDTGDNGGDDNNNGGNNDAGVGDGVADLNKPSQWPQFPWDGQHANATQWNDHSFNALDTDGLLLVDNNPKDIKKFCPNYKNLTETGKAMFWIGLLSAMGKYTSNWDPQTEFQESFNDAQGNPAVSRGLLQIDIGRAKDFGCPVANEQELHNEKLNLLCAVKIMNHWVGRDKSIAKKVNGIYQGGARFWVVLQKKSTLDPIKQMTNQLSFCK